MNLNEIEYLCSLFLCVFRPRPDRLPNIYTTLGVDYDERVLPSITNEVLKAVVAQFDAGELITNREMLSNSVREELVKRAEGFGLILDDIAITHLTFGREFTQAVELKQVISCLFAIYLVFQIFVDFIIRLLVGRSTRSGEGQVPCREGGACQDCCRYSGRGRHRGCRSSRPGFPEGRRGSRGAQED